MVLAIAITVSAQDTEKKKNIAVMDLQSGPGVSAFMINLINEYIGTSVYNSTEYHVISGESLKGILEQLGKKRLLKCAKARCLASIGEALEVDKVIGGSIETTEGGYLVQLMLIQAEGAKTLASLKEKYTADESQLVAQLDTYIAQLFEQEKKTKELAIKNQKARDEFMKKIISESSDTGRRISYAMGAARITGKNMEPAVVGDFLKLRYKHARHHFGFGVLNKSVSFPDDGTVTGPAASDTVVIEIGDIAELDFSYGYEWLKLFSGWMTLTPGISAGAYSYTYNKEKVENGAPDPQVYLTNGKPTIKSFLGGYLTLDIGNAIGPVAIEGYYTFKLLYLPEILSFQEFGGRLSYILK